MAISAAHVTPDVSAAERKVLLSSEECTERKLTQKMTNVLQSPLYPAAPLPQRL